MDKKTKEIIRRLYQLIPHPQTELVFSSPYEAVVAVMLSAQCTDKRVNMVTPHFFRQWPTPEALAAASVDDIRDCIRSINFYKTKSSSLSLLGKMLVMKYNSIVPNTHKELTMLPGVGGKTANVILSTVFGVPALAVDTHVFRVSHRLGVSTSKDVEGTEKELCAAIDQELWNDAHHLFILFGRYYCTAKKPQCSSCVLLDLCPYTAKNL